MLSRVAESMFWMSRYMERAENTARFLDVNFHLLLDLNKITAVDSTEYWKPLILVTSDEARFEDLYGMHYNAETVTDFLVTNRNNPNSIYSCIALARENARSIIETISSEMWEQVNNLYHYMQQANPQSVRTDSYRLYQEIKSGSHLFQGITDSTLSHNEGWDFVQAGKYLERSDNTARLVDVKYHLLRQGDPSESVDVIQWMAVLKSCSALEAFRKVYLSRIEPDTILQFLALDRFFPRSIYFSVAASEEALWRISGSSRHNYTNNADRLVGKLQAELSYTTIEDIHDRGLHEYLEDLEQRLTKIGEQIHQFYFAYNEGSVDYQTIEATLPFTGLAGGRAVWSQAQQQQQ